MTFYSIVLCYSHLPEVQLFSLFLIEISGTSSGHLLDEPFQIKADSLPIYIFYFLEILFTICRFFILPPVQLFVSPCFLPFTRLVHHFITKVSYRPKGDIFWFYPLLRLLAEFTLSKPKGLK